MAPVVFSASIKAAAGKSRKVTVIAYTGGVMKIVGWGPVLIDLAGLKLPDRVSLTIDHADQVAAIAGSGTPQSDGKILTIVGMLTDGDAGQLVAGLLGDGIPLQASVEVEPGITKYIRAGETVAVNGQNILATGDGFTLIVEGSLRAVSFVPTGADKNTSVRIAAGAARKRTYAMQTLEGFHEWLIAAGFDPGRIEDRQRDSLLKAFQAERAAEGDGDPVAVLRATRDRRDTLRADIERDCDTAADPELIRAMGDVARSEDWTPERWRLEMYRAGQDRPRSDNSLPASRHRSGESPRNILAAGILIRAGYPAVAEKLISARAAQAGQDLRCHSLVELCAAALRMDGRDVPSDRTEMIRAAFSTASLPVALGDSASKVALDSYREVQPTWRAFARIVNSRDFKTQNLIRLVVGGAYEGVGAGGELKHGTLGEQPFTVRLDTRGKMFGITRQDVINDDLQLFMDLARSLGKMGARSISDQVYKVLLLNKEPDGATSFFTAGRGNYATGAGTVLSFDSLSSARATMAKQVDTAGRPVDLQARSIVVPPELETLARQLLTSEMVQRDVSSIDNRPMGNPFVGKIEGPQVEPRLSNALFTGYSAKAWYLFAAPADGAVAVGFLDGKDAPTVEQAEAPFNMLGVQYRGYIDFGVSLCDYVAAYKAKGEV